ncbi:MAG TPA: hypothetical protein VFO85_14675, partial [Vicinamibacteria bacterium]|nr:hypothetical protein [Vicinamibacteria bacterium]
MRPAVTRVLSFHADYACRRAGACCTAGWPIAAEARVEAAVRGGLAAGKLRLPLAGATPFVRAPDGGPTLLGHDDRGRCAFFVAGDANACAIHRDLGHEWLPLACRQFPRASLLSPAAVSITLSHYCPTAAALLFRDDGVGVEVVESPAAFPDEGEYEGLDARAALPLLRPRVFLDWGSHRRWEEHAVATLGREDLSPEAALGRLAADAEKARAWTPARGPMVDWIA